MRADPNRVRPHASELGTADLPPISASTNRANARAKSPRSVEGGLAARISLVAATRQGPRGQRTEAQNARIAPISPDSGDPMASGPASTNSPRLHRPLGQPCGAGTAATLIIGMALVVLVISLFLPWFSGTAALGAGVHFRSERHLKRTRCPQLSLGRVRAGPAWWSAGGAGTLSQEFPATCQAAGNYWSVPRAWPWP